MPSMYVLLYRKLMTKRKDNNNRLRIKDARLAMSQPIGIDKISAQRVLHEMKEYNLIADVRREEIILNDVEIPDV